MNVYERKTGRWTDWTRVPAGVVRHYVARSYGAGKLDQVLELLHQGVEVIIHGGTAFRFRPDPAGTAAQQKTPRERPTGNERTSVSQTRA